MPYVPQHKTDNRVVRLWEHVSLVATYQSLSLLTHTHDALAFTWRMGNELISIRLLT